MKYNNILDTIGRTPLVRINRIWQHPSVTIWGKIAHKPLDQEMEEQLRSLGYIQ